MGRSRTDSADFNNFKPLTWTSIPNPTEVVPTGIRRSGPRTGVHFASGHGGFYRRPGRSDAGCGARGKRRAGGATAAGGRRPRPSGGIEADAQYLVQTVPTPVQVMNISFGACESAAGPSGVNFWDSLFQQAAAEGISSFVSSGDSGASGCDAAFTAPPASPQPNSPNYICSSSYATCVGGTEFNDTSDPTLTGQGSGGLGTSAIGYIPEGGWNESWNGTTDTVAASGGGVSSVIATPTWQQGVPGVPTANAGGIRPMLPFPHLDTMATSAVLPPGAEVACFERVLLLYWSSQAHRPPRPAWPAMRQCSTRALSAAARQHQSRALPVMVRRAR